MATNTRHTAEKTWQKVPITDSQTVALRIASGYQTRIAFELRKSFWDGSNVHNIDDCFSIWTASFSDKLKYLGWPRWIGYSLLKLDDIRLFKMLRIRLLRILLENVPAILSFNFAFYKPAIPRSIFRAYA